METWQARMLVATIQHPVPLFDDSYSVNSANLGPYGDAIVYELIPTIEVTPPAGAAPALPLSHTAAQATYRGLGQGWARGLYGGSTGGWEALGVQVRSTHTCTRAAE
jgi:hypothetical protein